MTCSSRSLDNAAVGDRSLRHVNNPTWEDIMRVTHRTIACIAALAAGVAAGSATAGSLGGPLELQDEGSFFIGGHPVKSDRPSNAAAAAPGDIMTAQMYVQY